MVAYGLIAALSLQENGDKLLPDVTSILMATSLPGESVHFIFILNIAWWKFQGVRLFQS